MKKDNRYNKNIDNKLKEKLASYDASIEEEMELDASEAVFEGDMLVEAESEAEDDTTDGNEIREFASRDDIVTRSRSKVNQPGRQVNRKGAGNSRNTRMKKSRNSKKQNAGFFEKLMEYYKENTMQVLFCALGVLAIILMVAIIAVLSSGSDEEKNEPQSTEISTEETSSMEEESTSADDNIVYPEVEGSRIHTLITSYIDAAYIKADMDEVALYVDDVTNINVDTYKSRQKYIESYQNITCYKLDSAIENSYIVFVTYDAKLYNIDTLAPSAETFIVVYNLDELKYYVHNLTVADELDGYIAEGSKISYISEISEEVKKRLDEAIESDAELKRVFDIMSNAGQSTEETSTSAEAASTTEATSAAETTSSTEETTSASN